MRALDDLTQEDPVVAGLDCLGQGANGVSGGVFLEDRASQA